MCDVALDILHILYISLLLIFMCQCIYFYVVDALDTKKFEKNEYFVIFFLSILKMFCRFLLIFSFIFTIFSIFQTVTDFIPIVMFTTLVNM